ncbi:MAG: hypothetical protein ACC707_00450 [Thiohalomonadales bacterium]
MLDSYIAVPHGFVLNDRLVCPPGVLKPDFNILPDTMQRETRGLNRDMRKWSSMVLRLSQEQGVFTFSGPAEDKALVISAALQGASLMAGAESSEFFEIAVTQIKCDLGLDPDTL